ncbi:hypothetical protein V500_06862 [Pseudogymnoascus sp. VKM F-4518 (FW-2643)]|nr:hypothetical protein V500_06862 [Pseudogymnoascus sp. VKM F-4518 (FW-2643)]
MAGRPTMSMEAALDEERLDVLELLQGLSNKPPRQPRGPGSPVGPTPLGRSSSPYNAHRSPVRSMLDVVEDPRPRHSSIAGTSSSGVTPIRSMLDIGPPISQTSKSASTSPTDSFSSLSLPPKGLSELPPHQPQARFKGDVTDSYQFSGYLKSNPGAPLAPRRNTLAGKKAAPAPLPEGVRVDLPGYNARDRVHAMGTTGIGSSNKSRSPHNRHSLRSSSPALGPPPSSNMLVMDSGAVVDKDSAYRRLSDANLARAGGSFSALTSKVRRRTDSNDKRDQRLQKDYTFTGAEDAVESSDEASTDEDGPRGRKSEGRISKGDDHPESKTIGMGRAQGQRTARSLMAAAEEERQMIEDKQQYKVRSLLEPEITVTGPGGDRLKGAKLGVHPTNAFDQEGGSGLNTPHDSDTEQEISDIRRAQRLAINLTPITSTPETQRSVRTLFRGDFIQMQKEAEEHQRRVRKYLVATDLSEEAAHALEWTVGTVLRDGDTLLAIYCVDEETGIIADTGIGSADTATMEKQAASIASATHAIPPASISSFSTMSSHSHIPSPLGTPRTGVSASPMSRDRPRTEQERHRAVENITERVSKLLRKTKLQVRVVIEVIHCKSPKHLICEVIDYFNPTLVILGSRGRSALKGVILGSFSNYLVTKSSVPVMVARKRLRKHNKYKRSSVRLANNLTGVSGKTLASAKID